MKTRTLFRIMLVVSTIAALPLSAQAPAIATPSLAVEEFIRAAADSNLTRMSQLWGNARGSAARTGRPKEYGKRMVIMQAYLTGVQVRTLGEVSAGKAGRMLVTTELSRGPCKVTLPVTAVKAGSGWVVTEFDLAQAGEVNKPCEGSGRVGNPGS